MGMIEIAALALGFALALLGMYLLTCIRVLNEYERGVVFRLGRAMPKPKGPGLILVFWPVDRMMRVDLRTITKVIEPQDVITRDNVSVRVNAVLYFRVVDPMRSVLEVADFLFATSQVALTTLRSTLGQAELDDLLTERDKVNRRLQEIIDGHTEPWGVKVSVVEVKDVDLPEPMKRSMAHQAEAERDRRAKIINAEGEFQAADKLRQAAQIMAPYPMAMQMRYLQTLTEVASERNSTIIFPLPIELLRPFLGSGQDDSSAVASKNGRSEDSCSEVKTAAQSGTTYGVEVTAATARGSLSSEMSASGVPL
ncbi:slipin family protein [Singulisphaera acidiphila]|uniref:Membrane protease subunit, stomatin/prohibitin n=1 Tax=Singulisphaera acidiphila (strain ATCC BAA-1392 / DSM 18658 / VKM B-2454 / MOB10) TaxID=886293 RepID=L0DCG2_SINAD|nr:slipin family protein [Singulisphaera acidiphila]AGA26351.1 membrane protease subunit, stomatin/prohibitin [Singulisphaera acidiphila DSM 18658]